MRAERIDELAQEVERLREPTSGSEDWQEPWEQVARLRQLRELVDAAIDDENRAVGFHLRKPNPPPPGGNFQF